MPRPFGSDAVLNGKPGKWGGDNYGWQSPDSFSTIPKPSPMRMAGAALKNLFGGGGAKAEPTPNSRQLGWFFIDHLKMMCVRLENCTHIN